MNYVLVDDEERALNLLRIMLTRFNGFSEEKDRIYTFTQPALALRHLWILFFLISKCRF